MNTQPQVSLSPAALHVDRAIESRLHRICHKEWKAHQSSKRKRQPLTYSASVTDLLAVRQRLYAGESPEYIMAEITTGQIQHDFLSA